MKRLATILAFALAALAAPAPGTTTTVANFSACADAYTGSGGGCAFEYVGVRVLAWAVAAPGTTSVTIEARYTAGGRSNLVAECTVSGAAPVCTGEPIARPAQVGQKMFCVARGTGNAVFGCLSQKPFL